MSYDVLDLQRIGREFEDIINMSQDDINFTSKLSGIGLFPTILAPTFTPMKDFVIHRRDGAVDVGCEINHADWVKGGWRERVDLFAKNVILSISKIKKTYLNDHDRLSLTNIVEIAREKIRSRDMN